MLKSGNLYKLGDGPINYNWNLRYFVLDGKQPWLINGYRTKLGADLLHLRSRYAAQRSFLYRRGFGEQHHTYQGKGEFILSAVESSLEFRNPKNYLPAIEYAWTV